ncbi:MAG: hypothetical protein GX861_00585 [Tenericutes bacterium]|jgi:replication initiation and membrane attachment protein|nr:hypothetical protein [Mycoplasmatota bacterium]
MKNINILPADTYVVVNKTFLKLEDRRIITMLYQPIIGYTATSLYFTLWDDLDRNELLSEVLTHHHLMATMQLKLDDIIIARKKLEAVGLIRTYYKTDHLNKFMYLLYSPIDASEFFNHPILNIVLYNNLGKKEYEQIIEYFKVPKLVVKDYEDITLSFDEVFTPVNNKSFQETENIKGKQINKLVIHNDIDFNAIVASIPKSMINGKVFTSEIKELISNLSYIYNIDLLNMQGLIRNSLNEKGLIDIELLRKSCLSFYQFENGGKLPTLIYSKQPEYLKKPIGDISKRAKMIYTFETVTPYDFLKSKYNNGEPTARDLKLIESLMVDQQLKPGVVNVLIDYVLKINDNKLNKNYMETIAGQWKRLNIETVQGAMEVCEKNHKKNQKNNFSAKTSTKSVIKITKKIPDWFDKELDHKKTTPEEQQELDELLKEFS